MTMLSKPVLYTLALLALSAGCARKSQPSPTSNPGPSTSAGAQSSDDLPEPEDSTMLEESRSGSETND